MSCINFMGYNPFPNKMAPRIAKPTMFQHVMKTLSTVSTMFIPRLQLLNIINILNNCRKLFRHFQQLSKTCSKVKSQEKFCPPQKEHAPYIQTRVCAQTRLPSPPLSLLGIGTRKYPPHAFAWSGHLLRSAIPNGFPYVGRSTPSINAPQKRL